MKNPYMNARNIKKKGITHGDGRCSCSPEKGLTITFIKLLRGNVETRWWIITATMMVVEIRYIILMTHTYSNYTNIRFAYLAFLMRIFLIKRENKTHLEKNKSYEIPLEKFFNAMR